MESFQKQYLALFVAETKMRVSNILCITKYGSTLYIIGMDEVLALYACTFELSNLYFHFQ